MKKIFALPPSEDWILDRIVKEWYEGNPNTYVDHPSQADIIWLVADYCWRQVGPFLNGKKVLTTVHHIVPEKFNKNEIEDFKLRDKFTTAYHVPNKHTANFIRNYTDKNIHVVPYWVNPKIWKITSTKSSLREKYNLPKDAFILGSFQRDTEGSGISKGQYLPKLEKGPDLFADYAILRKNCGDNIHVLLAGWRRHYLISRLEAANVPFTYVERPSQEVLNELYQTLDLYPVSSRVEGGPQSLIECGLLNIPMVSRDMGMSDVVLPQKSINDSLERAEPSIPNVKHLMLPEGFNGYRKIFESL